MADGQTMTCSGCGRQIGMENKFCPYCGRPQNVQQPGPPPAQPFSHMRMCSGCGRQIPVEYNVCPYCGRPQNQPLGPIASTAFGVDAKSRIIEAARARQQSDKLMEGIWLILIVLLPLIVFIGVAIFFAVETADAVNLRNGIIGADFLGAILVMIILAIIALIFFIVTYHKLLERNDAHSRRERMLREGMIEYFTSKARERGMEQALAIQLATMNNINSESNAEETNQHNWYALLLLVPVIGIFFNFYILYILTQYDAKHNQRWQAFAQQTQYAGQALGMTIMFPSWKSTPQRSFFLYLVLDLLTGLFSIYWLYVLLTDVNEHYKAQWQFEDQLIRSI